MGAKRKAKPAEEAVETVTAYKGFDSNWQCRGFQYAVGQTYTMDGPIKACEREQGAASATGYQGAAMASGFYGRVSGKDGNALFLTERIDDYGPDHGKIIAVWAGIVGQDGVKADTWYSLNGGKPVEVTS